jgi:hypothetical protein
MIAVAVEGRVPRTAVRGARSAVHDLTASGPRSEDRGPRFLELDQAEGWRRRMEAGEFGTVRDLAIAVNLAERHVSRQLRLAYLAPEVLKRLTCGREASAVSLYDLCFLAGQGWQEQVGRTFK